MKGDLTIKDPCYARMGHLIVVLYECKECKTTFPKKISPYEAFPLTCNGVEIRLCPWCREDSQPFTHGRGL